MRRIIQFAECQSARGDCPQTQSALHDWVAQSSKHAASEGITPEQAWQEIVEVVGSNSTQPCEVWDTVERAYAFHHMAYAGGAQ